MNIHSPFSPPPQIDVAEPQTVAFHMARAQRLRSETVRRLFAELFVHWRDAVRRAKLDSSRAAIRPSGAAKGV